MFEIHGDDITRPWSRKQGNGRWKIPGRCCENGKVLPTADMSHTHTYTHTNALEGAHCLSLIHTYTAELLCEWPSVPNVKIHTHCSLFWRYASIRTRSEVLLRWGDVCTYVIFDEASYFDDSPPENVTLCWSLSYTHGRHISTSNICKLPARLTNLILHDPCVSKAARL